MPTGAERGQMATRSSHLPFRQGGGAGSFPPCRPAWDAGRPAPDAEIPRGPGEAGATLLPLERGSQARGRRPGMLFSEAEATLARAVGQLSTGNPFLPERLEAERLALGDAYEPAGTLWHSPAEPEPAANVVRIAARATALTDAVRGRLAAGTRPRADELALYEELVLYVLYERHQ